MFLKLSLFFIVFLLSSCATTQYSYNTPRLESGIRNAVPSSCAVHAFQKNFIWPVRGDIVTAFKQKRNGVACKGIDIITKTRQDIQVCQDGRVTFIGDLPGYGKTLIVEHAEDFSTIYSGVSSILVRVEDSVKQGMVIARTGNIPRQNYEYLHFQIRKKHKAQNPLYYLN